MNTKMGKAKQLEKKHDPEGYGEYTNESYCEMYIYALSLEKEIAKLKKKAAKTKAENTKK